MGYGENKRSLVTKEQIRREAFCGMLKSETYYLKKFQTYEELKEAISDYIDYYNNHRYQKRLNRMTPIEYRNHLKDAA